MSDACVRDCRVAGAIDDSAGIAAGDGVCRDVLDAMSVEGIYAIG